MSSRLPPLSSLRAFEAAARRLSFRLAAEELGVTPTAVSHQIRSLEDQLGVALFRRLARKVALTPEGAGLAPALTEAFARMGEAVETARRAQGRRVATLSATIAFTAKLLAPRAARFREMHPGFDLRLHASDDAVDLSGGEADAAIRYGLADPGERLDRTPLITDRFAPVASPRLALKTPADLGAVPLIHFDWPVSPKATIPSWRVWAEAAGMRLSPAQAGLTLTDETSAILAAVAGQGVALLSVVLVEAELRSGLLEIPFGPELEAYRFDFVHAKGAESRPAVAALKSWILAEFSPDDGRAAPR